MAILSPDRRAALAAELAKPEYAGLDDAAAADALNAPSAVPNPTPDVRPVDFNAFTVGAILSAESIKKIFGEPSFEVSIRPLLNKSNKTYDDIVNLCSWAATLAKIGDMTPEEYATLASPFQGIPDGTPTGLFQSTEPVPDRPATVPGPSPFRAIFGDADFVEIRPGAVYDPKGGKFVPVDVEVTFSGHATPAMVAEARG